jgi:hypothetical protein
MGAPPARSKNPVSVADILTMHSLLYATPSHLARINSGEGHHIHPGSKCITLQVIDGGPACSVEEFGGDGR